MKSKDNNPPRAPAYGAKQSADPGRNTVILKDSCQIVTPVSSNDVSKSVKDRNYGLSSPGNIQSYLEVVDLMSSRLRYVGVEIVLKNDLGSCKSPFFSRFPCLNQLNRLFMPPGTSKRTLIKYLP